MRSPWFIVPQQLVGLSEQIAETVAAADEVEDEIRHLCSVISGKE